jgi:hypothetical protein
MMQGEAYRRLLWLAVLVVGLFGSAYVVAECTGAQCCFDDYMRNIGRCHTKWGAPINQDSETENQATSREMTLRACLDGAKEVLRACLDAGKNEPQDPAHTDSLTFVPNGGFVLATTQPIGSPPQSYAFDLEVPEGHGGHYTLTVLNGAGYDSPHPDHLQRVQGTIQLNGLAAVDEFALNGESHRIEVPVTLEEGRNTLSVEINQVDDSWFGFATLVLRNW